MRFHARSELCDNMTCDHPVGMRNSSTVAAILTRQVAFIGDAKDTASVGDGQHEMSRLLLHRLIVLAAALQRIAELQCEAAQAPIQ